MLELLIGFIVSTSARSVKESSDTFGLLNGILGSLMTLVGLIIGIYTLVKVKGVERAQAEARKITQKLLGVDNIESDYLKMMKFLSERSELEAKPLLIELSLRLGSIRGIRKVLSASGLGHESTTVLLEKGYFSQDFIIDNIDGSTSHVDILTGRAQMISSFAVLEKLRIACERGVKVRLITLCEHSDDNILEDSLQTVAFPAPTSFEAYREQLKQCTRDIKEKFDTWSESAKGNFLYETNKSVPRISSVRADDCINLGFLQLYRDAQPQNTFEREYIKISTSSETGKVLLTHFECVSKASIVICGINPLK